MICYAILAHNKEEVLHNQISNIRHYNPNSKIVLYNGGTNKEYGKSSDIIICPYSRPLQYGKLGRFLYDVMRWLEEVQMDYDYLVSVDSDIMFVNFGYETFLEKVLNQHDCVGVDLGWWEPNLDYSHEPKLGMSREWDQWSPFFGTHGGFYWTFNPMQVFTHQIVRKMIPRINVNRLERLLSTTNIYALEEMLHVTLAWSADGRLCRYPSLTAAYTKLGDGSSFITKSDMQSAKLEKEVFFVHPVKRDMSDPARKWITQQITNEKLLI